MTTPDATPTAAMLLCAVIRIANGSFFFFATAMYTVYCKKLKTWGMLAQLLRAYWQTIWQPEWDHQYTLDLLLATLWFWSEEVVKA